MTVNHKFISTRAVVGKCSTLQLNCINIFINCIIGSLTASHIIRYSFEIEVQVHGSCSVSEVLLLVGADLIKMKHKINGISTFNNFVISYCSKNHKNMYEYNYRIPMDVLGKLSIFAVRY